MDSLTFEKVYSFKKYNLEVLPELQDLVVPIPKIKNRRGGNWRKFEGKNKTNWMVERKFNQDENERLYSQFRNILNKLSDSNQDELSKEIVSLGINTKEQLQKLVDTIFQKAINEKHYLKNYAVISKELAPYFIEEGPTKTYFRELLLIKCQLMFTEAITIDKAFQQGGEPTTNFKFKDQTVSCIRFIGELYNQDLLTTTIINNCFKWIFSKIETNSAYIIDILCGFFETVAEKFSGATKDGTSEVISKIEDLKNNVPIKEKFTIMDLLDKLAKNKII